MNPSHFCRSGMRLIALCGFLILVAAVHGVVPLGPFCERANSYATSTGCPDVSTFDVVDTAAYAGMWYEIGSTAQFKLLSEAGLNCLQANYTLELPTSGPSQLSIVNSGVRSLGAIATLGVTSISAGAKDVCTGARDVCSYLGPQSATMQSVTELRRVADMVRLSLPEEAVSLDDVALQVEGYGRNISKELTMLAAHVARIQIFDGYLSAGNGTAAANVEQIKLDMIAVSKHVDAFVEFVREMAAARSLLAQVALKLVLAGEFVSSVDITEASALIGAAEQSIALHAERMKTGLSAMSAASEVLLAAAALPDRNLSWSFPGVATRIANASGRLEVNKLSCENISDQIRLQTLEPNPRA